MKTMSTGSLFAGLSLMLLVAAPALPSSRSTDVSLRFGDAVVYARRDAGALVAGAGNPWMRFAEDEGASVVVRMTPIDPNGGETGPGRVVVVGANEQREVRLRDELAPEALDNVQLRIEVLRGRGRVTVTTADDFGPGLVPQTDAAQSRRRAVSPGRGVQPTSVELIDRAEAAGTITSETALLYRVYALFSDARLPQQYRGDDSKVREAMYITEARDRYPSLSPATQAAVLPFLIPPAYSNSWANSEAGSPSILDSSPPTCADLSERWGWVDTSNGFVRIWYKRSAPDGPRATALAQVIDNTIWPKISGLMTDHTPLDDSQMLMCNGGDRRLDFYLTDIAVSYTAAFVGCSHTPAFIVMTRSESDATAAHEIFHAFQFSYVLDGCMKDANYGWWTEASANWAEDFVFPKGDTEQIAAGAFLDVPHKSLDFTDGHHEYGAYLLPFYVHRKTGSAAFVKTAWENCAKKPALEAVNDAIPGGFDAVWPEFVRYNWNQDAFNDYFKWDGLESTAVPVGLFPVISILDGKIDDADPISVELPRLSAIYKHYKFPRDSKVSTVAFWNGVTFKLTLEARIEELGVQYQFDPAGADEKKGAHVEALIKLQGQDWKKDDWTDRSYVSFCRDMLAERLEELVLIISNSEFKDRDRKLKPPALAPVLWTSNMGCWQWKGTAAYTDGEGVTIATNVTWTRPDASLGPPFVPYNAGPEGTENWSSTGANCNGSGTLKILTELAKLFTYNFTPTQGSYHRSYFGAGVDGREVATICPATANHPAFPSSFTLSAWLFHPPQAVQPGLPFARFLLVNANGRIMDDSFTIPGTTDQWIWHFEAQREP